MDAVEKLERRGIRFPLRHCCNSAGVLRYPDMHLDLVRPGIILYGLAPDGWMEGMLPLKPAMELKTVISMVKTIPAGAKVSYAGRFTAWTGPPASPRFPSAMPTATPAAFPIGRICWWGGRRARVVGRVCMDQCMLDVTDIPAAREGMTVTVFGRDGEALLPAEEFAALSGTIHYETICLIGKRVPRIFLSGRAGRWGDSIISCRNE